MSAPCLSGFWKSGRAGCCRRRSPGDALCLADLVRDGPHQGDIHQRVERVGGRFDHDDRDAALGLASFGRGADAGLVTPSPKPTARCPYWPASWRSASRCRRRGAAVEDHVAGPGEGQDRGRDGRHAGGEQEAGFRLLEDGEPILNDLGIGVVESGIDEPRCLALWGLAAAGRRSRRIPCRARRC